MKKNRARAFWMVFLAAALSSQAFSGASAEASRQLFTNGRIYTGDARPEWAEAVVVENGKFIFVGDAREAAALVSDPARATDFQGRVVIPGLYDSHVHPAGAGEQMLYTCNVANDATFDDLLKKVRECADAMPEGAWIQGGAWGPHIMRPTDTTYAEMLARLDEAAGGRPTVMSDFSHHNIYANSAAMQLSGAPEKDLSGFGDLVVRDENGDLTGFFVEEAGRVIQAPSMTAEQTKRALQKALEVLNQQGFVGVMDSAVSQDLLGAYADLDAGGNMSVRAGLSLVWEGGEENLERARADFLKMTAAAESSPHMDAHFAKILVDGVPPTKTAAFLAPYRDSGENAGTLQVSAEELAETVTWLDAQGITAQFHTVGDRAARVALDAIAAARRKNGDSGRRHQLAHACLVDPADVPRFAELNAVANFSPMFWYPNALVDGMRELLGDERVERYCASLDLVKDDAAPTGGSDWPVVAEVNPWNGIEALVTRQDPNGLRPDESLWPEQKLTLKQALALYTINGARVMNMEDRAGSIEVGKFADMVVLNQDVFSAPIADINKTRAVMTIFEGRTVHRAEE